MTEQSPEPAEEFVIPIFPGWLGLTDAGAILGMSRQGAHKAARAGVFKTVHRLEGRQAVLIVRKAEVEAIKRAREEAREQQARLEDGVEGTSDQ